VVARIVRRANRVRIRGMSIKAAQSESQSCAVMSVETPSVLIEGASIGRPAAEAPYRDGPRVPATTTSRDSADLVLPPPETKRWTSRRKAAILVAVRTGVITREEACHRYLLSEQELASWEVTFDRSGISGLLLRRLQPYRRQRCHGND
jgi:hypothetical protein